MPIYEYTCGACGHAFEHLHRRLSEPAPACPKCGAARSRKELSVFSAAVATEGSACPARETCSSGKCSTGTCPFSAN